MTKIKRKNTISLVINTKNEEENITECITSVSHIVDEIIVVDMMSTDKTVELAKKSGAKVFKFKETGYVEPARNFAIQKATKDWVLILDADERISPKLSKEIPKLIQNSDYVVFALPRKNVVFGKWVKGNNYYWPDHQVRLFKRGVVNWSETIHTPGVTRETIHYLPSDVDAVIEHYMDIPTDNLLLKTDKYSSLDTSFQKYIAERDFSAEHVINYLNHEFLSGYILKKGYKDDFEGFILYKLMETYRFAEIAKWWLRNDKPELKDQSFFIDYYKYLASDIQQFFTRDNPNIFIRIKNKFISNKVLKKAKVITKKLIRTIF